MENGYGKENTSLTLNYARALRLNSTIVLLRRFIKELARAQRLTGKKLVIILLITR
jgi:hypothetical protein